ncbi:MAG: hypothetical protein J5852_09450, partial [Clostridia bacterium]|nr:hypothetical protein [Clostridia bacterium]
MKKAIKSLSVLLAVLMVALLIPVTAFAGGAQPPQNVKVKVDGYYSSLVRFSGDGSLQGYDGNGNWLPLDQIEYVHSGGLMIDTSWDSDEAMNTVDLTVTSSTPESTVIITDAEENKKATVEEVKRNVIEFDTRCLASEYVPAANSFYRDDKGRTHTKFLVPVLGTKLQENIINKAESLLKTKVTGEGEATFDDLTEEIDKSISEIDQQVKTAGYEGYRPAYIPGDAQNVNWFPETNSEVINELEDLLNYSLERNCLLLHEEEITAEEVSLSKEEKQGIINAVTQGLKNGSSYAPSCGVAEGDTLSVKLCGFHDTLGESDFSEPVSFVVDNNGLIKSYPDNDPGPQSCIIHYVYADGKKAAEDANIAIGETVASPKISGYTPDKANVTYYGEWLESITVTYTKDKPKSVKDAKITIPDVTYNAKAQTPAVKVILNGETLKAGTDYTVSYSNNVNAGTGSAKITGIGNFTDFQAVTFTIKKAAITPKVTLSATSYTYNGKEKKPSVTVKSGDTTLKNGTDYTVAYSNNVNAGTAAVKITGKGNYTFSETVKFAITKAAITPKVTLSATSYTYDGKEKKPSVTVKKGDTTLKNGTDYTVTYPAGRKNAGKYKVVITLKGNYSGSKTVYYKINKAKNTLSLTGKTVSVKYSNLTKNSVTVKRDNILSVTKPRGKTTYSKTSGNKSISVNKNNG